MLLLFDIDGTLLHGAAVAHAQALRRALHEVYGVGDSDGSPQALPHLSPAGRTDLQIAREILLSCGLSARQIDDGFGPLREATVREYARCAPADLSDRVIAGIAELLDELLCAPGIELALLTGNLEPIAHSKLTRAGLARYFDPWQGAFGSDSEDRSELPAIARRRAGVNGRPYPRAGTVVIGDTPLDIACARADGLRCIAVSTGPYSSKELAAADRVAENSAQLSRLIRAELGPIRDR